MSPDHRSIILVIGQLMSSIPFLQLDAFTDHAFAGNPAAVCLLNHQADPQWMQAVAAEMNLSETAFLTPLEKGLEIRWFTPTVEVDLCGHATLAAASALWHWNRVPSGDEIVFQSRSGELTCVQANDQVELDFPSTPPVSIDPPYELCASLGIEPVFVGRTKDDFLIELHDERTLRDVQPDFAELARVPVRGTVITARADDDRFDFVSRFFAPAAGVYEDPVTGSAHCALGPYWADKLGRSAMTGYQASKRGGVVGVRVNGSRTTLIGSAVVVLEGKLVG